MYIVIAILAAAFLVFCVIPLHEFAHAWAADRQGDDTPRNSGRLTLSPMAHVDPIGGVLIALIGSPRRCRRPSIEPAVGLAFPVY